jgi:hypothetical protein
MGTPPDVSVSVLHNILCHLRIAEQVTKIGTQARGRLAIPGIEGDGIACGDLRPEFPFVEQMASPMCSSGKGWKRFEGKVGFLKKQRRITHDGQCACAFQLMAEL